MQLWPGEGCGWLEGAGGLAGAEDVGRRDDWPARREPDPGSSSRSTSTRSSTPDRAAVLAEHDRERHRLLERFLALAAKPVWEITADDVDLLR